MGFISIGNVFKSITSGLGDIAKTALQAVAPAATKLLQGIVGDGFDALKTAGQSLVGNLPFVGGLASKLLGMGVDKLKSLSQGGLEKLIQSLVEKVAPRNVPGTTGSVTLPAAGTAAREAGAAAATAATSGVISSTTGTAAPSGNGYEDQLAAGAAGAKEPTQYTAAQLDAMTEGEMIKYQEEMQKHARLMDMYSKLIQAQNDMKKGIIANFRV